MFAIQACKRFNLNIYLLAFQKLFCLLFVIHFKFTMSVDTLTLIFMHRFLLHVAYIVIHFHITIHNSSVYVLLLFDPKGLYFQQVSNFCIFTKIFSYLITFLAYTDEQFHGKKKKFRVYIVGTSFLYINFRRLPTAEIWWVVCSLSSMFIKNLRKYVVRCRG